MPVKREMHEGVYGTVPQDPRDMVKAILPEPQSPGEKIDSRRHHA